MSDVKKIEVLVETNDPNVVMVYDLNKFIVRIEDKEYKMSNLIEAMVHLLKMASKPD